MKSFSDAIGAKTLAIFNSQAFNRRKWLKQLRRLLERTLIAVVAGAEEVPRFLFTIGVSCAPKSFYGQIPLESRLSIKLKAISKRMSFCRQCQPFDLRAGGGGRPIRVDID